MSLARLQNTEIISAFTSTAVVDTPMRKVEILEDSDGMVILRDTQYRGDRVIVTHMQLLRHESTKLAQTILRINDMPAQPIARKVRALNGNS